MYKLEMHLHTKGNSTCGKEIPSDIIDRYKKEKYDGIVVTNHFNKHIFYKFFENQTSVQEKNEAFLKAFKQMQELGKEKGIDIFFGLELAVKNDDYHNKLRRNCAEILVYGITVSEFLALNVALANMSYQELYECANKKGWILVQAHPYRGRTKLIDCKFLHGIEVYNGHPYHINRNNLALKRAISHKMIKTAGSDFHCLGYEGTGMTLERKVIDEKDLAFLLRTTEPLIFKRKEN